MERSAIVTGGSNGIGRGIVQILSSLGIDVVFSYYSDEEAAQSLKKSVKNDGTNITAIKADMGKIDDVERLFRKAEEKLGHIDILVNNAGVFFESTL